MRAVSTRELVLRLNDELSNGLKYDRKRNVYTLVWTDRQLRNARRRARRLYLRINAVPSGAQGESECR